MVREFLDGQLHMVISSIGADRPEAALVGFTVADGMSLIFGTDNTTSKLVTKLTKEINQLNFN